MISVTAASQYLQGGGDTATLVVPDRAMGAMVTVNTVLSRLTRLNRLVEDQQKRRLTGTRAASGAARAAPVGSSTNLSGFAAGGEESGLGEANGGGGGGHGGLGFSDLLEVEGAKKLIGSVLAGGTARTLLATVGRGVGVTAALGYAAYGAYDLYKQARDTGRMGVGDAALTGASAGGAIGSFFAPVIGTAIGAAIGAGVGAVTALAYNNSDAIVNTWNKGVSWIGTKSGELVAASQTAWTEVSTSFMRMGSLVGDTLHKAWTGVTESFKSYKTSVGDWITRQSHEVGTWLDGIVANLEKDITNFNLRSVAGEFMTRLRQWLAGKLGFGGGGGAGGGGQGNDAPADPSGFQTNTTAPSARGRGAQTVGTGGSAPLPVVQRNAPDRSMYQLGGTSPDMRQGTANLGGTLGGESMVGDDGTVTHGGVGFGTGGVVASAAPGMSIRSPDSTALPMMYQRGGKLGAPDATSTGAYGGDHAALQASPGRHPDTGNVSPKLMDIMGAAATHLPPGYTVSVNEGFNTQGHASHSQHKVMGSGALDLQIRDPQGKPIYNEGSDPTGMYTRLAQAAHGEQLKRYPELTGKFAWGGAFGTVTGGNTSDLMHYDLGGERGHITSRLFKNMAPLPEGPVDTTKATAFQNAPISPVKLGLGNMVRQSALAAHDESGDKPGVATAPATANDPRPATHAMDPAVPFDLHRTHYGVVDLKNGGGPMFDMDDPRQAKQYLDYKGEAPRYGSHGEMQHGDFREVGRHTEDVVATPEHTDARDLKSSWTPEHADAAAPQPTTIRESQDAPEAKAPPPPPPADVPADPPPPQTKHGPGDIHSIPKISPNAHIAVSGHTDKF